MSPVAAPKGDPPPCHGDGQQWGGFGLQPLFPAWSRVVLAQRPPTGSWEGSGILLVLFPWYKV